MEDYKEKYEMALERAKKNYDAAQDLCNGSQIGVECFKNTLTNIFPELKESEDEKIRKALVRFHKSTIDIDGIKGADILAWLEKQGEQKLCMIQWKGDNLKEVINFTGKDKSFDKWFTSFDEYEKYVREHNDIFKLFNEDGSRYEVPVGAWIIKTPDGRNVASKAVFKQKPIDKAEPKFKVGDWLQYRNAKPFFVEEITKQGYVNGNSCLPFNWENEIHLWTIQDAKDGDVLAEDTCIFINQKLGDNSTAAKTYCTLYNDGDFDDGSILYFDIDSTKPATKEQCDLLFQKMKEVGYEWDAEKKELKKIEKKPAWSEEDDYNLQCMTDKVTYDIQKGNVGRNNELMDWLKSIKDRLSWKPTIDVDTMVEEFLKQSASYIDMRSFDIIRKVYREGILNTLDKINK